MLVGYLYIFAVVVAIFTVMALTIVLLVQALFMLVLWSPAPFMLAAWPLLFRVSLAFGIVLSLCYIFTRTAYDDAEKTVKAIWK